MNNDEGVYLSAYLLGERAGYAAGLRDAVTAVRSVQEDSPFIRLDDAIEAIKELGSHE